MHKVKIFLVISTILLIFSKNMEYIYAQDDTSYVFPEINAESYLVMDANTHDVLFSQNEKTRYEPASLTKIMTAIIVIENIPNLHINIIIGKNPQETEPSSIYLVEGEIIDIESLLYATLLQSANDATVALAEYVAGSVESFAKIMNAKAKELGCTNTNFVNPNGLHDKNHYSTAKDMALILSYAINNELFLKISQTEQFFIPQTNLGPERELYNQNRILVKENENYYNKAICAKTGYTDEAGHTFAVAAKNEQMTLVAIFFKDSIKGYNIYAKDCFEYAFNNYSKQKVFNKGDFVLNLNIKGTFIPLAINENVDIIIKNGTNIEKNVSDVTLLNPDRYTYLKDEEIATAKLITNGKEVFISLSSQDDIILASAVNSVENENINSTESVLTSNTNLIVFLTNEPNNIVVISVFIASILICIIIIFIFTYIKYRNNDYRKRRRRGQS